MIQMAVADKDKDKIKLKYITIQLTLSCNYKCIMCNRYEDSTKNKFLPINDALRVIKEAKSIGVEMILLSGGEPLVYPWINEIIDKVKELNLGITFITNGILLNEQIIKKMEGHPTHYVISTHASNKKLNDMIRGVESDYNKVIENIKLIKKSMKNNENTKLEMAIVIMDENKKDFKNISSLLFSIGIGNHEIEIFPIDYEMCSKKYDTTKKLSLLDVKDYFKDYLSGKLNKADSLLAQNRGLFYYYLNEKDIFNRTRANIFDLDSNMISCPNVKDSIYIMANGDAIPCCIAVDIVKKKNIQIYGNIYENSLSEIINSKNIFEVKKATNPIDTNSELYKKVCINCDMITFHILNELSIKKSNNQTNKKLIDFLKVNKPDKIRELYVNNISNNNCDEGRNLGLDYDLKNHSYEFLKQIIEENYELGIEKIILMGREPTLHPNLLSIIRFIKSKGMEVEIHTNARMFFYEEYTKKIALSGINKIFVHFMSENEEEHDEITQSKCSFKQSKKGVINLIKYLGEEKVNIVYRENTLTSQFLTN